MNIYQQDIDKIVDDFFGDLYLLYSTCYVSETTWKDFLMIVEKSIHERPKRWGEKT